MLQNVKRKKLTNVKQTPNLLTSRTHPPHNSHATLTQLSLFLFREKFVPLQTLRYTPIVGALSFLHVPSIVSLNILSSWVYLICTRCASVPLNAMQGKRLQRQKLMQLSQSRARKSLHRRKPNQSNSTT